MKLGYIGLGLMGQPCALNLLKAGHQVAVFARRAEMMQPLIDAGATPCSSPAEVAARSEVIFTNVSDSSDVEAVVLGEDGVINSAKPNSVVVDMSTISPITSQKIAQQLADKDIHMLDAPVSGGPQGAIDGTLTIMVGGKAEIFARVLPLLQVMGSNIVHIGDHGAGQISKACNQIVVAQTIAAIGEAFILARAAGVDPNKVRQALMGGFAGSKILEVHGQRMLDDVYTPGFKTKLHQKDMTIVQQTASQLGISLPGSEMVTQWLNESVEQGLAEQDSSVLVKRLEAINDIKIKP